MEPVCSKCQKPLNIENWLLSRKKRNQYICASCIREDNNNRYQLKKTIYSITYKAARSKTRNDVLLYYGSKCEECGETNLELLSLDHIDGGGRAHRKRVLGGIDSGSGFFKWVLKNKPINIRLLCYNCNCRVNMTELKLTVCFNEGCKYCGESIYRNRICRKCSNIAKRNSYIRLKINVFDYYWSKCANCGIDKIEFLTIDHINNDGAQHRKEVGTQIFPWLKMNNYPTEFQILCFNCNYLKRNLNY